MMDASELVQFICSRNTALCDFVTKLREAGFDYRYRLHIFSASDNYLQAVDVLIEHEYGA